MPTPTSGGAYRPRVEKMSRAELEDDYCRIYSENRQLKLNLTDTETKLKR